MAKKRAKHRTIETDIFGHFIVDKVNSKAKGDDNERVAAKLISKWTGEKFSRVPRSGGLHWKNASNMCGDIACENEDFKFPFVIETKHCQYFASPNLDGKPLPKRNKFETFWKQVFGDSLRAKKLPMVLARKNGMEIGTYFVCVELLLAVQFLETYKLDFDYSIGAVEDYEVKSFMVMESKTFFRNFPYENFATYINKHYLCGDN